MFATFIILIITGSLNFFPLTSGSHMLIMEAPMAPMDPEVWVEVEHEEYNLVVEPGKAQTTNVRGWVHCVVSPATPPGTDVAVSLTILGGLYLSEYFYFRFDRTKEVEEFLIILPEAAGASVDNSYSIRFYPEWSMSSPERHGAGESTETHVSYLPYGRVHVREMEEVRFDVGEWEEVEVIAENNGNCDAMLTISADGGSGIEVEFTSNAIHVTEGTVAIFLARIKQGSGGGKDGSIRITVTSSIEGEQSTGETYLEYRTTGRVANFLSSTLFIVFLLIGTVTFITAFILVLRRFRGIKRKKRPSGRRI
jgi:hypothetical protein